MSIPKRTMSRFRDDIWAWKSRYDQAVSDYWQEMREAIREGDEKKLTELREKYFEIMTAAREASLTEVSPEEAKGKERIVMAATVFCHIYASFDTNRKGAFNDPLFGRMLHDHVGVFDSGPRRQAADDEKESRELYEQIGRLKMELEWLKKKAAQFE